MLHRAASLLIISFWLTMTALLVRNEIAPEGSSVREVPVAHVLKLLFQPERGSGLNITSDSSTLGHLNLTPHIDATTQNHVLGFDSSLQMRLGLNSRQSVKLEGQLELDPAMALRHLTFTLVLRDPTPLKTEVDIDPEANRAHTAMRSQSQPGAPWQLIDERDYSLDQQGARDLLGQVGLDPALLTTVGAPRVAPVIRARQSSLVLHGVRVDTYLLTIEQSGQTLMEIQISQLGYVLQAKTLLGYNFAPDDPLP
jgi:hypothetical protein